jgi:hypothetical protein
MVKIGCSPVQRQRICNDDCMFHKDFNKQPLFNKTQKHLPCHQQKGHVATALA